MLKKRKRKTKKKKLRFNFISTMEEVQLQTMESYDYFPLFQQNARDKLFTVREILNIFKFQVILPFFFDIFSGIIIYQQAIQVRIIGRKLGIRDSCNSSEQQSLCHGASSKKENFLRIPNAILQLNMHKTVRNCNYLSTIVVFFII